MYDEATANNIRRKRPVFKTKNAISSFPIRNGILPYWKIVSVHCHEYNFKFSFTVWNAHQCTHNQMNATVITLSYAFVRTCGYRFWFVVVSWTSCWRFRSRYFSCFPRRLVEKPHVYNFFFLTPDAMLTVSLVGRIPFFFIAISTQRIS